jgi:molybdate transport system regulatory protein
MVLFTPKANFWAEVDGQVVLSEWRVRLLEAIDVAGSISGAAQQLDIPYKLAWERLHEMENRLGQTLVDVHAGGAGGGGAWLTPVARDYIDRWHAFSQGLATVVEECFQQAFGPRTAAETE